VKNHRNVIVACALALAPALVSYAQTQPQPDATATTTTTSSDQQAVQLPTFTVNTPQNDTSLTGTEAMSTTRVATDLFNLSQTVTVLNRAMIDIVNPMNMSDMVNYIGGAQTGTLNWTSGRLMIRGFSPGGDGDFVDGFNPNVASNVDMFMYDRIEVVKGASAIFFSNGLAGGTVNKITKSPTSYSFANFGVEYGAFDSGKLKFDAGGPITTDGKLMYRVLATDTHLHGYYDNTPFHRILGAVMLKYQFTPDTQLTLKEWYWKTYFPSFNPAPLDPNTLTYFPGLSYKRDTSENAPSNWRKDLVYRTDLLFTTRINSWSAFRIAAQSGWDTGSRVESVATSWTDTPGGTAVNGVTGQVGSGVFAVAAPGTSVPGFSSAQTTAAITAPNGQTSFTAPYVRGVSVLPRSTTAEKTYAPNRDLQMDYDFNFDTGPVSQNLLVGGSFVDNSTHRIAWNGVSNPIDIYTKTPPTVLVNLAVPTTQTDALNQTAKLYIHDSAGFFNDRLLIDYGWVRVGNTQDQNNDLVLPHTVVTPQYYVYQNLRDYGGVFKVTPGIAVFYSWTQTFQSNAPGATGAPTPSALDQSKELGVRGKLLDNRLTANVSYFQASASNQTVPSFPFNGSNVLIGGIISHGFDGDASFDVTPNFTLLGTFADMKTFVPSGPSNATVIQPGLVGPAYGVNGAAFTPNASDTLPTQVPEDNVARHTYSLLGRYSFTDETLKGLTVAAGVDYQSKRAITNNANQVFFGYVPARTLVNAFANYRTGHILYGLNIDNLFDTKYIYSSRSVNVIEAGMPINIKGSVTYNF